MDLGAGCGFQSIPLAEAGYSVTAIDLDAKLLDELKANSNDLAINIVQGDLLDFETVINGEVELIVSNGSVKVIVALCNSRTGQQGG